MSETSNSQSPTPTSWRNHGKKIQREKRRVYSSHARVRALLSQKEERKKKPPLLFIFLAETSAPVTGGRWGERPPARSPAAGVVEGSGGPYGPGLLEVAAAATEESKAIGPRRECGGGREGIDRWWAVVRGRAARRSATGRGGGRRRPGQVPGGGVAPGRAGMRPRLAATAVEGGGGGGRRSRGRRSTAGALGLCDWMKSNRVC